MSNIDSKKSNSNELLFTEYVQSWLAEKRPLVAKSTFEAMQIYVEKHIIPYFSSLGLYTSEIRPRHIKEYYAFAYQNGRSNKPGGLSIASVRKHAMVINEVLDNAVMDEIIPSNPARGVKMPARGEPVQTKRFATAEEINRILSAFDGNILQKVIFVAVYYGLRRSEVLGLKWKAIDFDNNTISINHTIVRNLTIEMKDSTKTASSNRTYSLIEDVRKVLLERKHEQDVEKSILGDEYVDNGYVFTRENGEILPPDYVTKVFKAGLKKNGLPAMRFHDLRHSTASILFEKGWSIKEIQLWLRHSDLSVTADIYTHISEAHMARKGDSLNNTFAIHGNPKQKNEDSLSHGFGSW